MSRKFQISFKNLFWANILLFACCTPADEHSSNKTLAHISLEDFPTYEVAKDCNLHEDFSKFGTNERVCLRQTNPLFLLWDESKFLTNGPHTPDLIAPNLTKNGWEKTWGREIIKIERERTSKLPESPWLSLEYKLDKKIENDCQISIFKYPLQLKYSFSVKNEYRYQTVWLDGKSDKILLPKYNYSIFTISEVGSCNKAN